MQTAEPTYFTKRVNQSTYSPAEIARLARAAVKGRGRYRGWELHIVQEETITRIAIVAHYTEKGTGRHMSTSTAI